MRTGRKPLLVLEIGDTVDDLEVIDIITESIQDRGRTVNRKKYLTYEM